MIIMYDSSVKVVIIRNQGLNKLFSELNHFDHIKEESQFSPINRK